MEKDPAKAELTQKMLNQANQKVSELGQAAKTASTSLNQVASELNKLTSWPNPTFDTLDQSPWQSQSRSRSISDCPCPSCVQVRQQHFTPEDIFIQLKQLHFTVRDLTAQTKTQDRQIVKLEGLVQMLVKALGVNEVFLSEAYKGAP